MQKILVPTDFSQNALEAATFASEVAIKARLVPLRYPDFF